MHNRKCYMMNKKRILVVCTANSCRSQMAEGFFRYHGGDNVDVYSAGTHPSFVNTIVTSVMREKGIDISGHISESVAKYINQPFDYVITVCDNAKKRCPFFPSVAERLHWGFEDPAEFTGSKETVKELFRNLRNKIEKTIINFLDGKGWLDKKL